ncbi:MAG: trehalose-phosphatase [Vicinamibacterales bacterium]
MLTDVQAALAARPAGAELLLLSDFDGTLAGFDPNPAVPSLSMARKLLLSALAGRAGTTVGLVSGRRIADLRGRTRLPAEVYYAGLHGLEIEVDKRRWQHPQLGAAEQYVRDLEARLQPTVAELPGFLVEDKGVSIAVHYRAVEKAQQPRAAALAEAAAAPWLASGQLRRLEGNCVIEYLPNIACHKGDAARWIAADVAARRGRPVWTVFFGDDVTDEDGFRAIAHGIGVLVGRRPSAATHRVDDPDQVEEVLRWLLTEGEPTA